MLEDLKAFFTRKRSWWLVAAAIALVIAGHIMEKHEMGVGKLAQAGVHLTQSMHDKLEQQQPGDILDRYSQAAGRHHVLCGSGCSNNIISIAFTFVRVTPAVTFETFREGGWFDRLLLLATIGIVLLLIYGCATDKEMDVMQRAVSSLGCFLMGPLVAALIFWLVLHILMLLTFLVGAVFSGIVVFVGVFGGVWQVAKMGIEALRHADEIEHHGMPFLKKVFAGQAVAASAATVIKTPPPTPPPAA